MGGRGGVGQNGAGPKTMNLVWDFLSLKCLLDIQMERSSRHLSMSLEFSKENHLLEELKIT